jgi:hypothetical protein
MTAFVWPLFSMHSDHSALRFGGRLTPSLIHFLESYPAPITLAHSYLLSTSRNHHQVIPSHHANYRSPSPPSVFDIFPMYQHTAIIHSPLSAFGIAPTSRLVSPRCTSTGTHRIPFVDLPTYSPTLTTNNPYLFLHECV